MTARWFPGAAIAIALASCASLDGLTGGSKCGDHVVDPGEDCDDDEPCCNACKFAAPSTVCRPAADVCDVAESCNGAMSACPANGFASASVVCRAAVAPCDTSESCTGTDAACPADVTTCAGACRPGRACKPGQTCSETDEIGCVQTCHCADEDVYTCSSSCCPEPAVSGKTCGKPAAKCDDACARPCSCEGGVWSCVSPSCGACPQTDDLPVNGGPAYSAAGTACNYLLVATSFARKCVATNKDPASNAWACVDQATMGCPEPAVNGKSCTSGAACFDACGRGCTCASGTWSCNGTCSACPTPEDKPSDGDPCLATPDVACTYTNEDATSVAKCTCTANAVGPNTWSCIAGPAPDCSEPAVTGASCSSGAACRDACGRACSCNAGTWTCPGGCAACPAVEDLPIQGTTCFSTLGTACTYGTTTCTCTAGTPNHWVCP